MPLTRFTRLACWFAAASVVSVGLFAVWSELQSDLADPPNILLISIDTLRADRLGSYGYRAAQTPALDELAARGLRFTMASTVTPLTLPAHTSLLTGLFPTRHGVRDNGGFYLAADFVTLAESLQQSGYRTGAFVSSFVLDSRWGLDQGFETYFDDFDLSRSGQMGMDDIQRQAASVVDQVVDWFSRADGRPFFAWVHLYDPHTPYESPEPYRSSFPATVPGAYDAEIAYTDAQVGRLLKRLDEVHMRERTVVVVVGDHGESLGEHGEQTHGFFIYESTIRIPLIVSGPGIAPGVVSTPARIVDVAPTLLNVASVRAPSDVQGKDLRAALPASQDDSLYAESFYPRHHYGWSDLRSISDGRFKYIEAPRPELYDLHTDPGEMRDLFASDPRRAAAMAEALHTRFSTDTSARAMEPVAMDAEVQARLQSLGYIGAGSFRSHESGRVLADPKDKIGLYTELKNALTDRRMGRADDALRRLGAVLKQDQEMVEGHSLLGSVLLDTGKLDEAANAFRRALALDPEHRGATFNLALTYKTMGRLEEAEAGFARARTLDPRDGKPLWHLADIWMQRGELARARALLEESLTLQVDRASFHLKLGECLIEAGEYDVAERELQRALEARPHVPRAHYGLALIHEHRGHTEAAERAYERELALHPNDWAAAYNLGQLLLRQRRAEDAAKRLTDVTRLNPAFAGGHLHLGKARLETNDLEGAERAAREGLARHPDPTLRAFGHFLLADIYSRQGRTVEAEHEAARGLTLTGPTH